MVSLGDVDPCLGPHRQVLHGECLPLEAENHTVNIQIFLSRGDNCIVAVPEPDLVDTPQVPGTGLN